MNPKETLPENRPDLIADLEEKDRVRHYALQLKLLDEAGILNKLSELSKSLPPDRESIISEKKSGRFVYVARWNYRDEKGVRVCDESGLAYLGTMEAPVIQYEAWIEPLIDQLPYSDKKQHTYFDTADTFLVWGDEPQRVFFHADSEIKAKVDAYADEIRLDWSLVDQRELNSLIFEDRPVDWKKTQRDIESAKVESSNKFEQSLEEAFANPKVRVNPSSILNPQAFDPMEQLVRDGQERKKQKILSEEMRVEKLVEIRDIPMVKNWVRKLVNRKQQAFALQRLFEEQEEEAAAIAAEDDAIAAELDISSEHPQDDCHFDDVVQEWDHGEDCEDAPSY